MQDSYDLKPGSTFERKIIWYDINLLFVNKNSLNIIQIYFIYLSTEPFPCILSTKASILQYIIMPLGIQINRHKT